MDILFVVPYVPNLIRVRPYNLIKCLAKRGHRLTVVALWSNDKEYRDIEELRPFCERLEAVPLKQARSVWNCLVALPTSHPLQSAYCWTPKAAAKVTQLLSNQNSHQKFDVAHVEHLRASRYGLFLKQAFPSLPIVWDSVDSISLLFRQATRHSQMLLSRWLLQFELHRTEHFESWLIKQFDHTVVTSRVDKESFITLPGGVTDRHSLSVVPNGVDLSYFIAGDFKSREPATLVISGKMSYHANVTMVMHFMRNILEHIHASRPDVKVWIVGKDPPDEIAALGASSQVTITGTVNDIRPYLQKATIAIAPLTYGAGVQNKVLEAMACATPVVAYPQATSALETLAGRDLIVAENPESFSNAVIKLLDHPNSRQQIGQNGRLYVENYHRWESIAAKMEKVYNEVIYNRN
ncbi:MAG: glycosyltransferase [Anaerolineales bacterium]|nr:glycosyltransferase [Anaerolineales bacterium]